MNSKLWRLPVLVLCISFVAGCVPGLAASKSETAKVPAVYAKRLAGSYMFKREGWTYVHLQGTPEDIGFQHGYLLAPQVLEFYHVFKLEADHDSKYKWAFYRKTAKDMFWPRVPTEYREEMKGIAEGVEARGVHLDLWDIVAMNAETEISDYYIPWLKHEQNLKKKAVSKAPAHCSAFIATGDWTKSHKIVIAHNNWTSYAEGEHWTIMFDIKPEHGYRILMDGAPGLITSEDDFGINSDGLMITETTISGFLGWKSSGIPEFVRAREAMQYAGSIDQYAKIMEKGNNGGYANDWLIGDQKTGEIGYLELGLTHWKLWKKKNGYFVSSNFPRLPALIKTEVVGYNPKDLSTPDNARHVRWLQLMKKYKGQIDVQLAEKFLGDHYDTWLKKEIPDQRTLCGHFDNWQGPVPKKEHSAFAPFGAVQGKVTDSAMTAKMEIWAHAGHPGGESFYSKPYFKAHPKYDWEKPIVGNMISYPWTEFQSGEKAGSK
jgi:hypothetical protein